jgi:hypothetical protein
LILYHGTTEENFKQILENGFYAGTYFSPFLDTALSQGGDFVFSVLFKDLELEPDIWEVVWPEKIPVERILNVVVYQRNEIYKNYDVEILLKQEFLDKEETSTGVKRKVCLNCSGKGQLEEIGFKRWREIKNITVCEVCKGYGSQEIIS